MLRALQALVGAHDADVVPHEAAQLVPVVGDDDLLVGVGHAALVPGRQAAGSGPRRRSAAMSGPRPRPRRTPGTRAASCWPCGWRRAGRCTRFRRWRRGPSTSVRPARSVIDAAAGVVRGRHHRDRLAGDVDAELQAAARRCSGSGCLTNSGRLVADVEVDAVAGRGASSRGRWRARRCRGARARRAVSKRGMKRSPAGRWTGQPQPAAFAAQRLGDQERPRFGWYRQVGWNCMNSMLATRQPARQAMAMPSPVAPCGLVE